MFTHSILLALAGLAAQSVLGAPTAITSHSNVEARGSESIDHSAVVGFEETAPPTIEGTLMLRYKPTLKVFGGCVPFPAVDANGKIGGGLDNTGDSKGGCSSSTGQVYARAAAYKEYFAIMYSWYMPKDSPSTALGHRHDWEQAIVWLSGNTTDATIQAVSVSAHGGMSSSREPSMSGSNPRIGYSSSWPTNHQLTQTDTPGGTQPLVAWDQLPAPAQSALQSSDFGSAIVPFKDSTFTANLAKGYESI